MGAPGKSTNQAHRDKISRKKYIHLHTGNIFLHERLLDSHLYLFVKPRILPWHPQYITMSSPSSAEGNDGREWLVASLKTWPAMISATKGRW